MQHIIPINDIKEHSSQDECWCKPKIEKDGVRNHKRLGNKIIMNKNSIIEEMKDMAEHREALGNFEAQKAYLDYAQQLEKYPEEEEEKEEEEDWAIQTR